MSDSEPEEPEPRRGRPRGQTDATKRYRRTAAEISQDKIKIAEMRLEALRESEERKLSNKKPRTNLSKVEEIPVKENIVQERMKLFETSLHQHQGFLSVVAEKHCTTHGFNRY